VYRVGGAVVPPMMRPSICRWLPPRRRRVLSEEAAVAKQPPIMKATSMDLIIVVDHLCTLAAQHHLQ
jgi:hypothetical protein